MWEGKVCQSDSEDEGGETEDEGGETESQKSGSSEVSTEQLQKVHKMCKNLVELLGRGVPERPDSAA
jgi:hypothetical protein